MLSPTQWVLDCGCVQVFAVLKTDVRQFYKHCQRCNKHGDPCASCWGYSSVGSVVLVDATITVSATVTIFSVLVKIETDGNSNVLIRC